MADQLRSDQLRSDQDLIFGIDVFDAGGQRVDVDIATDVTVDDVAVSGASIDDSLDFDAARLAISKSAHDGIGEYTAVYLASDYDRPLVAGDRLRVALRISVAGQIVPLVREFNVVQPEGVSLAVIESKLDQALSAIANLAIDKDDCHNNRPHLSRRHRQIAKAFDRDLRAHGIPIAILRNGFSDPSCAIHTQPRYSSSDDEGFITTSNTEYFLMRRSDYRSASQVTQPKIGDRIIKTATGESFEVINDDDGRNLDDTQPEINKLRIPVRRVST